MTLFRRSKTTRVEVCERCGSVCDGGCRADAALRRARERTLPGRVWVSLR